MKKKLTVDQCQLNQYLIKKNQCKLTNKQKMFSFLIFLVSIFVYLDKKKKCFVGSSKTLQNRSCNVK